MSDKALSALMSKNKTSVMKVIALRGVGAGVNKKASKKAMEDVYTLLKKLKPKKNADTKRISRVSKKTESTGNTERTEPDNNGGQGDTGSKD